MTGHVDAEWTGCVSCGGQLPHVGTSWKKTYTCRLFERVYDAGADALAADPEWLVEQLVERHGWAPVPLNLTRAADGEDVATVTAYHGPWRPVDAGPADDAGRLPIEKRGEPMIGPAKVTHRVTWDDGVPTFHCDGDRTSTCHVYPDCACEYWTDEHYRDLVEQRRDDNEPRPGDEHRSVEHDECWLMPWLNNIGPEDTYSGDCRVNDEDDPRDREIVARDAEIDWEWEDSVVWWYADEGAKDA